jgi:drug/metabolite transporter (DMT)-like permease
MQDKDKFGTSDAFMLMAVVFWAVNFSLIKIALREFSPLAFNGIRMVVASVILVSFFLISKEGLSVTRSDFWKIIVLGLIGNTVFQMFFIHGLNWSTASNTAIVMAMTPVFVALLSTSSKQEKIHWAAWMGIVVSFVGLYLVLTKQPGVFRFSWQEIRGDLLILFGNMCWAVYTVFSKPLLERMSPLKLTSTTMAVGAFFYLPFCLKDLAQLPLSKITPGAWGALLYSSFFALTLSYLIWYGSVKRVGNTKTAIYGNITPILTVIIAYFLIAERITLLQAIGAVIIILGVYFTRAGYHHFRA